MAHGTFCLIDAGSAAAQGFVDGGGSFNIIEFAMCLNIAGVGRLAISLYGEVHRGIQRYSLNEDAIVLRRQKLILENYKRCDTIVFGEVLGHEKAFLIQNMCPITPQYMKNEYFDSRANIPVRVNGILEKELKDKASKVLALQRRGSKLIFPNVLEIESKLINQ